MARGILVVIGALFLSVLGLYAADTIPQFGSQRAAVGGVASCPSGTVFLSHGAIRLCVDVYEVSPSSACIHAIPKTRYETEENVHQQTCYPVSVPHAQPWSFVSLTQAQQLCASVGKRLPTAREWYAFAIGTVSDTCITRASHPQHTGTDECVSPTGVYDAVGNVWEWVEETIVDGIFHARALPATGYITAVDAHGVAITTSDTEQVLYGSDYFWSQSEGVVGMVRGGYYGSDTDAGVYAANASLATSFASQGIGFRCVQDM